MNIAHRSIWRGWLLLMVAAWALFAPSVLVALPRAGGTDARGAAFRVSVDNYLYANGNPVMGFDPSGNFTLGEVMKTVGIVGTLTMIANLSVTIVAFTEVAADLVPDAAIASVSFGYNARGVGLSGGFDVIYDFKRSRFYGFVNANAVASPLSYFKAFKNQFQQPSVTAGLIWNLTSPEEWGGFGFTATWPASVAILMAKTLGRTNQMWAVLSQLAKREHNIKWSDYVVQFTASPASIRLGLKNNSFTFEAGGAFGPVDLTGLGESFGETFNKINVGALPSLRNDLSAINSIAK